MELNLKLSSSLNVNKPIAATLSVLLFAALLTLCTVQARAEMAAASSMWGTSSAATGAGAGQESANMHVSMGISAAQDNAARKRMLYSGPNLTVVGSQSIIQIDGNNNVVKDIDQTAVNSGNQSLDAPID